MNTLLTILIIVIILIGGLTGLSLYMNVSLSSQIGVIETNDAALAATSTALYIRFDGLSDRMQIALVWIQNMFANAIASNGQNFSTSTPTTTPQ